MPPIGLLLGNVDFSNLFLVLKEGKVAGPYASLAAAKAAGAVSMNIGVFINTIINFVILAFAIFLLVRTVNRLRQEEQAPSGNEILQLLRVCQSLHHDTAFQALIIGSVK